MKWILILALLSGVAYAGYKLCTSADDGGLSENPALQEDTSPALPFPEQSIERPLSAERPRADDPPSQRDHATDGGGEEPKAPRQSPEY